MKTKMKIFNIILLSLLFVAPVAVHADDDLDDCVMFNPAFALCSTHSHNTEFVSNGLPANPSNAEDIAYMNEVIGMKTTVIVQQMKQQYDTLNAMIKRFKTQLEKAVLTSKLEAYTGNTSASTARATGGGYGGSSTSNTNGITGAEECAYVSLDQVYDCLLRNLNLIRQTAETDVSSARKQLVNDMEAMQDRRICTADTTNNTMCKEASKCAGIDKWNGNKQEILDCVRNLNATVGDAKYQHERDVRQSYTGR